MNNTEDTELPSFSKLPIGTIVSLKGIDEKLLIVSKVPMTEQNQQKVYFDYGATLIPTGLSGEKVFFFNSEDIDEIAYPPYEDVNTQEFQEALDKYMAEHANELIKGESDVNASKDKKEDQGLDDGSGDLSQLLKNRQESINSGTKHE
ncbi:DUF4176 domain-containing protein [Furfurilactobacillus sp. WILCCON 0119]